MKHTSIEAKRSIDPGRIQSLVLTKIMMEGENGLTCDEAEQKLCLSHQTCSARFTELSQNGSIVDTGRRRPTRSGRKAIVWRSASKSYPQAVRIFKNVLSDLYGAKNYKLKIENEALKFAAETTKETGIDHDAVVQFSDEHKMAQVTIRSKDDVFCFVRVGDDNA